MAARQNLVLAALVEAVRWSKPPSCRDLGFALGPRINAGGASANPTSASAC